MKQGIASFFLKNGVKNGQNLVIGINNYGTVLAVFFFCITVISAKGQEFEFGMVTNIHSTNRYSIKLQDGISKEVVLFDTKAVDSNNILYEEGIKYLLTNLLNKKVYFTVDKIKEEGGVEVSIIYDCVKNESKQLNNNLPCSSAKPLNVKLIKKGYVIYTGNNAFLKKIAH